MPNGSAVEEFKFKGYRVEIHNDDDPPNPRKDMDNLGTILYLKSARYLLGDEGVSHERIEEEAADPDNIYLPVYALIHSGIALKTSDFGDPWDSGQSGIIYTSKKDALKWFMKKRLTKKLIARVKSALRQEVKTFGEYLNGEVYGYIIYDADGEEVDSLWGIMPFDYAKTAAKDAVKALTS